MKVTLVSDLLAQPLSGVGRYGYELAAQVRQQLPPSALSFVSYRGAETWTQIERRLAVDSGNETNSLRAWARLRLRIASTRLGSFGYSELSQMQYARLDSSMPDAVLHLPTLQQIPRKRRVPTVVTVHDLSHRVDPLWHPRERVARLDRAMSALSGADAVVAVSQFTADALAEQACIDPSKVHVVHNGVSPAFLAETSAYSATDRRHVICVGTIEPRKNVETLLRAYATLPQRMKREHPLLLVGEYGWRNTATHELISKLQRHGWLRYSGHVSDRALAQAYRQSRLCVYPSKYEGFGLPVLEALASGTPVIAGNHSSIPEIAGGLATLVRDAEDIDELREAILAELASPWDIAAAAARSAHAASFTWARSAVQTIDAYRAALVWRQG